MVKFAHHLRATLVEEWRQHYIAWSKIHLIIEKEEIETFADMWLSDLAKCSAFYLIQRERVLTIIMDGVETFKNQVFSVPTLSTF